MLYLKDGLKTDLSLCRENCASLTSELSSAQQEVSRLKSECEEAQHQFKLRENDLKIEIVKRNNEFERAQNKLSVVIQGLYYFKIFAFTSFPPFFVYICS